MSSGRIPGPSSSTSSDGLAAVGPDPDPDRAAARRVADRVVDEDHDQLAEAGVIAADDRRLRIEREMDARARRGLTSGAGAVGGDVAEIDRRAGQGDRAGVGAGEQQEVLDERGQVADLGVDVVERLGRSPADGLAAVAAEVLDASCG